MKFLHSSDLHIGARLNGYDLQADQAEMLRQILSIAKQEAVDAMILAGDIFDSSRPTAQAIRLLGTFYEDLAEAEVPLLAIPGNHDQAALIGFAASVLASRSIHIASELNSDLSHLRLQDEYGPVHVFFLPYVNRPELCTFLGRDYKTLDEAVGALMEDITLNTSERNILIAHQFLSGALLSEAESGFTVGKSFAISASHFEKFDYVALGHLHRAQFVAAEQIHYSGSPLAYSAAEQDLDKGVCLVELREKGDLRLTSVPLRPLHALRQMRVSFDEALSSARSEARSNAPSLQDYVYFELTDAHPVREAARSLSYYYPHFLGLSYVALKGYADTGEKIKVDEAIRQGPLDYCEFFFEQKNALSLTPWQRDYLQRQLEKLSEGTAI